MLEEQELIEIEGLLFTSAAFDHLAVLMAAKNLLIAVRNLRGQLWEMRKLLEKSEARNVALMEKHANESR